MQRTHFTADLNTAHDGKTITVNGWVQDIRLLGKISFLILRDMTGIVQCVAVKGKTDESIFTHIGHLTPESVVSITGTLKKSKEAKSGFEIFITSLTILSKAEPLPIQVVEKDKTITTDLSKRLDHRCIDLRKPENLAIFKIQSHLIHSMQAELNKQGFLQVFTPCLMGVASESGAEAFEVAYYNTKVYLRQDPQLHRQLGIIGGVEKLYDIGPSWRAEKSHTTKHICEHRTIAPEMAFLKDETDSIRLQEHLITAALRHIKTHCKPELELLEATIKIPEAPFPELRFPDIYAILEKMGKTLKHDEDLDSEADDLLWQHVQKKYKTDFYFFNRFPFAAKPFYVMKVDDDPAYARSVDLNCKGLELSSGGQREHRYDQLIQNIKEKKMNPKNLEWFTQFFKWGACPHGGFAIGVERLTQAVLNISNIKETCLFPRDPERSLP